MNILKSMITCLPVRWQKPFNFSQFVQVQRLHTARRCMRNAGLLRCSTDRRKMYAALVRPVESSYRDTHTLKSLLHKTHRLHRWLLASLGVLGFGSILVSYNWDFVRQKVGQEGAEVVKESIKSEDLQTTAVTVSKALLQEMFRDEELLVTVSEWLTSVLHLSEEQLTELVVSISKSEVVVQRLRKIVDDLVEYLCSSPWVHSKVGELLVYAINTPYAREFAVTWVVDILNREEITSKLEHIITVDMLNNSVVRTEANKFAENLVTNVLESPAMVDISRNHISAVLGSDNFQSVAGTAAWSVLKKAVTPRWLQLPNFPASNTLQEADNHDDVGNGDAAPELMVLLPTISSSTGDSVHLGSSVAPE